MTDSLALRAARKERDVYKLMLDRLVRVTAEERKYLKRKPRRSPWFVAYRRIDGKGSAPHFNMDDRTAEWLEVVFEIAERAEITIRVNDEKRDKPAQAKRD